MIDICILDPASLYCMGSLIYYVTTGGRFKGLVAFGDQQIFQRKIEPGKLQNSDIFARYKISRTWKITKYSFFPNFC